METAINRVLARRVLDEQLMSGVFLSLLLFVAVAVAVSFLSLFLLLLLLLFFVVVVASSFFLNHGRRHRQKRQHVIPEMCLS